MLGYRFTGQDNISHLQKAIKGWTAGLILMIERSRAGIADKECLLSGIADHRVFDYFMIEIFEKTDTMTQQFLMKTSLLSEMTGEMAQELTGNADSHRILQQLDSQRFFTDSRSHGSTVYQYHPLFKEFLQSCAEGQFSRQELKDVQRRGAHILKGTGYADDAAGLFIRAKEWNGLSELVMENADSLISQGRYKVLESWITSIPSNVLNYSPWLLYYLGQCRIPQNPVLARKDIEAAYRLFKEEKNKIPPPLTGGGEGEGDTACLFLSWSAIVDTFLYEWKDFKPLDFWIEEFERLTAEYPDFPSSTIEEHAVSSIFGALMFRQPQNPRIHYWEEQAITIIQDSPDVTRRFSIGHNLIYYYCWVGNMDRAGVVVKMLLPVFRRSGSISLPHLMFLRAYALYNCYAASPVTARSLAEDGLRLGEKTGLHLLDNMFLAVGIYSSCLMGKKDSAERYFNMVAFEREGARCFDQITYYVLASIKALYFDDSVSLAVEHAKLCLKNTEGLGCPLLINQHRALFANALIEKGENGAASALIGDIRKVNETVRSFFHEYQCLLHESLIALKGRDDGFFLRRSLRKQWFLAGLMGSPSSDTSVTPSLPFSAPVPSRQALRSGV